nr:MAG TPA: hypothetical protein [Caudoviricetes sp.]
MSIPDKNYHYKPFKVKAFFYFRVKSSQSLYPTYMP